MLEKCCSHLLQVTNYHVVAKLATDKSGLQCCKVFFVFSNMHFCNCSLPFLSLDFYDNSAEILFLRGQVQCPPSELNCSWSLILQVFLVDARGNSLYREGKIIGFDPSYDLAVLKVSDRTYVQYILNLLLIYAEYILFPWWNH